MVEPSGNAGRRLRLPQRYVTVLLTFLCTCVCYIERVGFSLAYTASATAAGVNEATKGQILSVFYHGYASSQIVGGWAAQRYGGRRILLLSFVLWSVTSALTPTNAASVVALVVARLLVGMAQGFIFPSIHAVLAQWVPPHERSRSVSLTTSGMYLGAAIGMLFLPNLVAIGARTEFVFVAGMGAVWTLVWYRFSTDPRELVLPRVVSLSDLSSATVAERTKLVHSGVSGEENGDGVVREKKKVERRRAIPWKKLLLSQAVWAIVVNNFTFHYALYVLMNWLPTYFNQGLKISLQNMGFSKMLPYFVMFVFSNVGGVVADYLITRRVCSITNTRKLLNTIGFALASGALLLMPQVTSAGGAVFCSSVALGSCALARAGFAVNHMDIAPKYAGILMGISNTAGTLAGSIGVAATGHILHASALGSSDPSSWKMVFATPAGLCVASSIVFLFFSSGDKLFD